MYNCPVRWYAVVDEMSVDEMSVDELSWNLSTVMQERKEEEMCSRPTANGWRLLLRTNIHYYLRLLENPMSDRTRIHVGLGLHSLKLNARDTQTVGPIL